MGLGKLFKNAKEKAVSKIIAMLIRKVAEGDFGAKPAAVYWFLAGKKTYLGVALASLAFALSRAGEAGVCGECEAWVKTLGGVAAFLISIGLVDGAVRTYPPSPPIDERFIRR